jgi:hypothetical protein
VNLPKKEMSIFGNDQWGDCTCAGYMAHLEVCSQVAWSKMTVEPTDNALQMYEEACGYVLGDPSTDQGGDMQTVLAYLLNKGAPTGMHKETRHKIDAYFEIDPRNLDDVCRVVDECGSCYVGINCPNEMITWLNSGSIPEVWDTNGDMGNSGEGHCIIIAGWKPFKVVSWGAVYQATDDWIAAVLDESYGIVDREFLTVSGHTPLGMNIAAWDAQMQALKQP